MAKKMAFLGLGKMGQVSNLLDQLLDAVLTTMALGHGAKSSAKKRN